jgi:hypothetical protein
MRVNHLAAVVVACAVLGGCAGDGALPTSPTLTSGPAVPPPISPIEGEITIAAMEPSFGATLRVFDCDPNIPPNFSLAGARPKHFTGPCALDFRGVVDVELENEVSPARVIVEFRDGTGNRCAYADSFTTTLPAHTRQSITFGELMLSDNAPDAASTFCALPVTTIEVVISVFSGNQIAGTPVLSRNIPYTYTFVKG